MKKWLMWAMLAVPCYGMGDVKVFETSWRCQSHCQDVSGVFDLNVGMAWRTIGNKTQGTLWLGKGNQRAPIAFLLDHHGLWLQFNPSASNMMRKIFDPSFSPRTLYFKGSHLHGLFLGYENADTQRVETLNQIAPLGDDATGKVQHLNDGDVHYINYAYHGDVIDEIDALMIDETQRDGLDESFFAALFLGFSLQQQEEAWADYKDGVPATWTRHYQRLPDGVRWVDTRAYTQDGAKMQSTTTKTYTDSMASIVAIDTTATAQDGYAYLTKALSSRRVQHSLIGKWLATVLQVD